MGLIYMRTSPSGKYYIGRTIDKESNRWKEHVRCAQDDKDGCWLLNAAIRKYGGEAFFVTILEDNINDILLLQEREEYWIKYYDATNPDKGYNRSPGKGGHIAKTIQQYDLNGNFIKEWSNIGEILQYYNWDERNLYDCLSGGYSHFHNYLWKYTSDERPISELVNRYQFQHGKLGGGTTVVCIETQKKYPSVRALERALQVNYGILSRKFKKANLIEFNNLHYMKEN